MNSLVEFWRDLPGDATWHLEDFKVLHRVDHGFQLDCLPGPFKGPLLTAPVVLLTLSPGYAPTDSIHAKSFAGQSYYARSRKGDCDLPSVDEHQGSANWSMRIIKQFGFHYDDVRSKVAFVNLSAYKSKTFDNWSMLNSLPSSREAVSWAQSRLFPQAEAGRRIVICLRSAKYWGLKEGRFGENLFVPKFTRSGIMCHGDERDYIIEKVRNAIQ